jgi:perosamine synthetase
MRPFFFFKGRVALYAILKAMGLKPGEEVILPGFTCVVVPNAVMYLGGKPVYVDIDVNTYNIDPELLEEKITPRAKAIIAQHTFGIPAPMDKILEIAKKHNLFVIEDSCHAIGSKFQGREVGTFGDAAFFSSQWSKPVTTGLGGWAVVNNGDLAARMESVYHEFSRPAFSESAMLKLQYFAFMRLMKPSLFWFLQNTYRYLSEKGIVIGSSSSEELVGEMPQGYKRKMTGWQEKLLKGKIEEIGKITRHRKKLGNLYRDALKAKGVKTPSLSGEYEPIYLRYPVIVKAKHEVVAEAKRQRLELGDWFVSPVHPNLSDWENAGFRSGLCPVAEEMCKKVVNLPTHERIGEEEAEKIIELVSKYAARD